MSSLLVGVQWNVHLVPGTRDRMGFPHQSFMGLVDLHG